MSHDEKEKRGTLERRASAPREPEELREAMVPLAYAEKTMSSLLRLHEDLVEEKERRIDLYRRLMDREQQLAELKAYVRLLEAEKLQAAEAPVKKGASAPGGPSTEREQAPEAREPNVAKAAASQPKPAQKREKQQRQERPRIRRQEAAASGPSKAPILAWAPVNLSREGDGRTE